MRELIYLSDSKLRQFLPEKRKRALRGNWQLNSPMGGVGWEPEAADEERLRSDRLRQVVKHVSSSARWFTEQNLSPGTWVEFEAPLNYRTLRGVASGMVLFVDPPSPVTGYDSGGSVRLLLHGSSRHLTSGQGLEEADPPSLSGDIIDGGAGSAPPVWVETVRSPAGLLVDSLTDQPAATSDEPLHSGDPWTLAVGTRHLLDALDRQLMPETAPWVRGFARITVALNPEFRDRNVRYVVGTPLYVEYAIH
ncbi:SAVMC3_10250 family protein [Streptomyces sp. NPDC002680]|uniref:SAVMC3_10250 family protein n=1 Tax=Streptomyces sp. NPDC002680 TaxID=3364659 RepID=UPI0036D047C1